MTKHDGNPSENLVQRVAEQMFLRDLVVRSPKLVKGHTKRR